MIEPLRLRDPFDSMHYMQHRQQPVCVACKRRRNMETPATWVCLECKGRAFCDSCDRKQHLKRACKTHKRSQIVLGKGSRRKTIAVGDGQTFPRQHDWVTFHYTCWREDTGKMLDSSRDLSRPIRYQAGTGGSCIHVQVLGADGLIAADAIGFSDPYVVVMWDDKVIGITKIKPMTLNPRWKRETFVVPIETEFVEGLRRMKKHGLADEDANIPRLKLEVFDYDRFSSNDFLGQVALSPAQLYKAAYVNRQQGEPKDKKYGLRPRNPQGKLSVSAMKLTHPRNGKVSLYVRVCDARRLERADVFSLSDPYVKVFWNGLYAGETPIIMDTLNPDWDEDKASFEIPLVEDGPNVEDSTLRLEVFDYDRFGSHDSLGMVQLDGHDIEGLVSSFEEEYGARVDEQDRLKKERRRAREERRQRRTERRLERARSQLEITNVEQSDEEQEDNEEPSDNEKHDDASLQHDTDESSNLVVATPGEQHVDGAQCGDSVEDASHDRYSRAEDDSDESETEDSASERDATSVDDLEEELDKLLDSEEHLGCWDRVRRYAANAKAMIGCATKKLRAVDLSDGLGKYGLRVLASRQAFLLHAKRYFPLELVDSDLGEENVRGTLSLRLIFNSRGTILRGVDEAIMRMSLGEKATVSVRQDYAFGEAFGSLDIPPCTPLRFEVELLSLNGKSSAYFRARRNCLLVVYGFASIFMVSHRLWKRCTGTACPRLCCCCHISMEDPRLAYAYNGENVQDDITDDMVSYMDSESAATERELHEDIMDEDIEEEEEHRLAREAREKRGAHAMFGKRSRAEEVRDAFVYGRDDSNEEGSEEKHGS